MKYIFQLIVMLSDVMIIGALSYALYFMEFSVPSLVLAALVLWTWAQQDGFMAWRPKNIKAFMTNMKALGL